MSEESSHRQVQDLGKKPGSLQDYPPDRISLSSTIKGQKEICSSLNLITPDANEMDTSSFACQVKEEIVSDAKDSDTDEMMSLASMKKSKKGRTKSSKRRIKFVPVESDGLYTSVDIKADLEQYSENAESSFVDPSVEMLKSLVDGIGDVSIIWNVVRDKILPHYPVWDILLDKGKVKTFVDASLILPHFKGHPKVIDKRLIRHENSYLLN